MRVCTPTEYESHGRGERGEMSWKLTSTCISTHSRRGEERRGVQRRGVQRRGVRRRGVQACGSLHDGAEMHDGAGMCDVMQIRGRYLPEAFAEAVDERPLVDVARVLVDVLAVALHLIAHPLTLILERPTGAVVGRVLAVPVVLAGLPLALVDVSTRVDERAFALPLVESPARTRLPASSTEPRAVRRIRGLRIRERRGFRSGSRTTGL